MVMSLSVGRTVTSNAINTILAVRPLGAPGGGSPWPCQETSNAGIGWDKNISSHLGSTWFSTSLWSVSFHCLFSHVQQMRPWFQICAQGRAWQWEDG